MQIKTEKGKKIKYLKRNNIIYNPKKIIINDTSDLYKMPIETLKNTKIYNFTGKYFDEIYEEALKIERSNEIKRAINNNISSENKGEQYAKAIELIVNKKNFKNLLQGVKIEQIEYNIYSFDNKIIALKFDKNTQLKLINGTDFEQWLTDNYNNELSK